MYERELERRFQEALLQLEKAVLGYEIDTDRVDFLLKLKRDDW